MKVLAKGSIQRVPNNTPIPIWDNEYVTHSSAETGNNFMKPALFNATAVVKSYQTSCDLLAAISKHITVQRMQFISPTLLYGSNIFEIASEREMFIRILEILNTGKDISRIVELVPEDITARLKDRTDRRSAEFCVIVLNNDVDDIRIEHLDIIKHVYAPDRSDDPTYHMLDDFMVNLYTLRTSSWIEPETFNKLAVFKTDTAASAEWFIKHWDFVYKLMMTYYKPGQLLRFSQTKGFNFGAIVTLLFTLRDCTNLEHWNWDADLWINLNLIGYNPIKEVSRQWRGFGITVNPGAIHGISTAQMMDLFVYTVNTACTTLAGNAVDRQNSAGYLTRYADIQNALLSYKSSVKISFAELRLDDRYDDHDLIKQALATMDEHRINTLSPRDEYRVNALKLEHRYIFATEAAGLIPAYAFKGKQGLNFSELTHNSDRCITTPNWINMISYLYKHRGWLSKPQPVNISRGRLIDVHPHNAIGTIMNDVNKMSELVFNSNPMITFMSGFDEAAKNSSHDINGPDFRELPLCMERLLGDDIYYIRNPFDLVSEGKTMGHCCGGRGYIRDCADEERVFFHYQPPSTTHWNEGVTFDCDVDWDDDTPFTLSSMNLMHNNTVPSEWRKIIRTFIDDANKAWSLHLIEEKKSKSDQLAKAC